MLHGAGHAMAGQMPAGVVGSEQPENDAAAVAARTVRWRGSRSAPRRTPHRSRDAHGAGQSDADADARGRRLASPGRNSRRRTARRRRRRRTAPTAQSVRARHSASPSCRQATPPPSLPLSVRESVPESGDCRTLPHAGTRQRQGQAEHAGGLLDAHASACQQGPFQGRPRRRTRRKPRRRGASRPPAFRNLMPVGRSGRS